MTKRIGFLEESAGVRSMTRLALLILLILAAIVVCATCAYVLHTEKPEAAIVIGLTGMLGALVLNGVVAIVKRNGGEG